MEYEDEMRQDASDEAGKETLSKKAVSEWSVGAVEFTKVAWKEGFRFTERAFASRHLTPDVVNVEIYQGMRQPAARSRYRGTRP